MKPALLSVVRLASMLGIVVLAGCAEPVPRLTDVAGLPQRFDNSLGMRMLLIPGGTFQMGPEKPQSPDQAPRRTVTLSPFYLSAFETTKEQFRQFAHQVGIEGKFLELDPGATTKETRFAYAHAPGEGFPIYHIDWTTAVAFADWLSQRESRRYRLPTEAEWEYAARAGTDTYRWWGDEWLVGMAVDSMPSVGRTPYPRLFMPGTMAANPWGLYEILGNAAEWTQDWYGADTYSGGAATDPQGPTRGIERVIRGGSIDWAEIVVNAYYRGSESPDQMRAGIRLVCEPTLGFSAPVPAAPMASDVDYERFALAGRQAVTRTSPIAAGVTLTLVKIPSGSFVMGSPQTEAGHGRLEEPLTQVRISYEYWIGQTEVTQAQYEEVMGQNPSRYRSPDRPVESVTIAEARAFCAALTTREQEAGRLSADEVYRLPTEPEWEYACRASSQDAFSYGGSTSDFPRFGWADVLDGTHPVGQKLPNARGVYDMHGNVGEWCHGGTCPHPGGSVIDPRRKIGAEWETKPEQWNGYGLRPVRGGSWNMMPIACRSAMRHGYEGRQRYTHIGFRIVCTSTKVDVSAE